MQTKNITKTEKILAGMILLSIVLGSVIGYTIGQTISTYTITSGIYPSGYDYTIYLEDTTYVAKNQYGYRVYYNINKTLVMSNVFNELSSSGGTVYLFNVKYDSILPIPFGVSVLENYGGTLTGYGALNIQNQQKYFLDNAYFEDAIIYPRAIYDSTSNRTFYCYMNGLNLDIYVIFFDHSKRVWSNSYFVSVNTGSEDYHYSPAIMIDNSGYIHVFFGVHVSSTLKHYKSTQIRNIESWVNAGDIVIGGSVTYPNVLKVDSNFYIFFRGNTDVAHLGYIKSTDNMVTFSSVTEIADMSYPTNAMYTSNYVYDSSRNAVHFVWYLFSYGTSKYYNGYHAYLDLDDNNVYSMAGVSYGTELTKAEADSGANLVFNSGTSNWVYGLRVVMNTTDNKPYIMFTNGGSNPATTANFQFTRWVTASWLTPVNMTDVQGYQQWGDFLISGNEIRAYLNYPIMWADSSKISEDNIAMTLTISQDSGDSWILRRIIMMHDEDGFFPYMPQCVTNANHELEVFFGQNYNVNGVDKYGLELKQFAYGQHGFVYRRYTP